MESEYQQMQQHKVYENYGRPLMESEHQQMQQRKVYENYGRSFSSSRIQPMQQLGVQAFRYPTSSSKIQNVEFNFHGQGKQSQN
jgi:hypothetical protein